MQTNEKSLCGLILAILIGSAGYGIHVLTKSPLADPLVTSMILGIITRSFIVDVRRLRKGLSLATKVFIPIGLILYSAYNLNFSKFAEVQKMNMIILLILVLAVYFISIIIAGRLFRQKKQITYLIANGSAICGASAIVITSPAIDAEADDVSISLLSVTIAAMTGLFIIFPFIATTSNMTDRTYGLLSGMVLQFTGFIRIATGNIPYLNKVMPDGELLPFALSIKAVRFLGLLLSIPLFTSLIKKRLYIPWVLWVFLISGVIGTWIFKYNEPFYSNTLIPAIQPLHEVSWSIALAAIGLNADAMELLSNNGTRALVMAFTGFFVATAMFFIGFYVIRTLNL